MTASDALHPVQFAGKADKSKSDRDKAAEYDARGADENEVFGYDEYDYGDNQWNRRKHADRPEVF